MLVLGPVALKLKWTSESPVGFIKTVAPPSEFLTQKVRNGIQEFSFLMSSDNGAAADLVLTLGTAAGHEVVLKSSCPNYKSLRPRQGWTRTLRTDRSDYSCLLPLHGVRLMSA